ncbi:DNA mismatch repair endonuclease MutL [Exiguobacterium oxidotolerans]|uniref:DNA mismatch repair endonuclease MutL n=1 Tax=Exiguobacterium oxidotolerans TaxID=223958 RepID=UPI0004943555|nr:DNA mismatch repair endonuclease MutL [Exiguobacterium oxidotolerans]
MGIIRELSDSLANRIAAGEVVERPASVVKELVENALDAGATQVDVELEEAGMKRMTIRDNGHGFYPDDAELAFVRHATSKIKDEHDLFRIKTLGFRGEALASIASVSKVTLKTKRADQEGVQLILEYGKLLDRSASAMNRGTELTVEHLFFNTPARLKYLKTTHTELAAITDVLNRMAFAHPEVKFRAVHEGKVLIQTNGSGDVLQALASVYGHQTIQGTLVATASNADYQLTCHLVKPEVTRASKNYITLILNGRSVKNFALSQAVLNGYHTLLPIGRFPIAVIEVTMDPLLIDVNVHPAKREVRLSKEAELCQLIQETIRMTLSRETLIPQVTKPKPKKDPSAQERLDFSYSVDPVEETSSRAVWNYPIPKREAVHETEGRQADQAVSFEGEQQEEVVENAGRTEDNRPKFPYLDVIGQLHSSYIVCSGEDGMYLIDQHAAQERIKYETYKVMFGRPLEQQQQLLLPYTFEVSSDDMKRMEEILPLLLEVGIELEAFGPQSFIVREVPTWFPSHRQEETIQELMDEALMKQKVDIEQYREDAAIMMACKKSIKANHPLNEEMMRRLIVDLSQTEMPFTCPHGRPVIIEWTTYELEKLFKRVM